MLKFRQKLESSLHHYLPKKVPQTKLKIYSLNSKDLTIEDEQIFTAEHHLTSSNQMETSIESQTH